MDLREKYLNTKTGPTNTVEVPGWGTVHIRSLSLADMESMTGLAEVDALARAVVVGVADEHGGRVFADEDGEAVKAMPFDVVRAVAEAVAKHNRLTADTVAEAKNG